MNVTIILEGGREVTLDVEPQVTHHERHGIYPAKNEVMGVMADIYDLLDPEQLVQLGEEYDEEES